MFEYIKHKKMDNYKILLLGPRGSGKTVYLSSMYYKMSMPNENMFFMEPVQGIHGRQLKHMYANLTDDWPEATTFDEVSQ
ncbi:hypothetical protein DMA11_22650 [Marinilabiliaceae bacterium JC017]|nr:hypothetical protein DMA11_22650 [Marinilabiliaceae bacterium JC017]